MTPSPDDAGIGLYVITLASSDLPMSLDVPFRHELVGFTVFRSRSFEHGRERFSLHVGYFESERRAEDALTVVCRHYPQAWIAAAPATNLSSLDNTLNTEFRLLRTAYARVVTPKRATGVEAPTFVAGIGLRCRPFPRHNTTLCSSNGRSFRSLQWTFHGLRYSRRITSTPYVCREGASHSIACDSDFSIALTRPERSPSTFVLSFSESGLYR